MKTKSMVLTFQVRQQSVPTRGRPSGSSSTKPEHANANVLLMRAVGEDFWGEKLAWWTVFPAALEAAFLRSGLHSYA